MNTLDLPTHTQIIAEEDNESDVVRSNRQSAAVTGDTLNLPSSDNIDESTPNGETPMANNNHRTHPSNETGEELVGLSNDFFAEPTRPAGTFGGLSPTDQATGTLDQLKTS